MSNLLDSDNSLFTTISKIGEMLILNFFWLICCIPVVTIVPSTTALYYAVVKVIRRERGYISKEFFHSFKQNLRQGVVLSLISIAILGVLYVDFQYTWQLIADNNSMGNILFGVFIAAIIIICAISMYICPLLSRFESTIPGLIKNAFVISFRHVLSTILLIVLMLVVFIACFLFMPAILFVPVIEIFISSFILERIFKKYTPAKHESEENRGVDAWYLE